MKAIDLGYYIINRGIENKTYTRNLALQKITYFANLLYLSKNKVFLINEENNFEAWMHGPVIVDLYREFASFAALSLYQKIDKEIILTNELYIKLEEKDIIELNKIIDYLLELDGFTLNDYSYSKNGAYYHTYSKNKNKKEIINKNDILKEAGVSLFDYENMKKTLQNPMNKLFQLSNQIKNEIETIENKKNLKNTKIKDNLKELESLIVQMKDEIDF